MAERTPQHLVWALLGQLLGMVLVAGVLWLHCGYDVIHLTDRLSLMEQVGLYSWPLGHLAVFLVSWRRTGHRLLLPLLVSLAPAVLAFVLASMSSGNLNFMTGIEDMCSSFLAVHHRADRLRVFGMLASSACWLGTVPALLAARDSSHDAGRRISWALPLAGLAWLAVCVWTFMDPLLPATSAVGGPAVRGLWVLALAVGSILVWTMVVRSGVSAQATERALAISFAVWAGLLLLACAVWLVHRADALQVMSYSQGLLLSDLRPLWFPSGLVLAAAVFGLAPLGLGLLALAWSLLLPRAGSDTRKRALGLLAALAVMGLLATSYESGFRQGFADVCTRPAHAPALLERGCREDERVFGVCLLALVGRDNGVAVPAGALSD